jgi:chromosome segregation ATPase
MTDTSPAAIAALLDGVTEGPWVRDGRNQRRINQGSGAGNKIAQASVFADWKPLEQKREAYETCARNARFIAAARDLVPTLAAERDDAVAMTEDVRRQVAGLAAEVVRLKASLVETHEELEEARAENERLTAEKDQLEQDLSDMRDNAESAYRRGYWARGNGA